MQSSVLLGNSDGSSGITDNELPILIKCVKGYCFKMADETNLSSKIPVADRTLESEEESSVGDALALAFR